MSNTKIDTQEIETRSPQEIAKDFFVTKLRQDLEFGELKAIGLEDQLPNYKEDDEKLKQQNEEQQEKGADFKKAKEDAMVALRPWVLAKVQGAHLAHQKQIETTILEGGHQNWSKINQQGFYEVNEKQEKIYQTSSFWGTNKITSDYSITEEERMAPVLKFREENHSKVVEILKQRLSEMEKLKLAKGVNDNVFAESSLTPEEVFKVQSINMLIQMSKGPYKIKPDEIGQEQYSTFVLIPKSEA